MGFLGNFIRFISNFNILERDILRLKKEIKGQKIEIDYLKKCISDSEKNNYMPSKNEFDNKDNDKKSVRNIIIENISKFCPLLIDLTSGSYNGAKWNDLIFSFQNTELNSIWERIGNKSEAVIRMFAVWGFKPEMCTSFIYTGNELDLYEDEDNVDLEIGQKYEVLSKCWLLTTNERNKSVIVKGKVKKAV